MAGEEFWASAVQAVLPYIITILSAAASLACVYVVRWINTRIQNEQARGIALRLNDEVWTTVREMQQTTVNHLKDLSADGKLDKGDAEKTRDAALEKVKSYMGSKGIASLQSILKPKELEEYILARIEAAIYKLQQEDVEASELYDDEEE